jgi:ubiquinone/menaquinone biosynthesis C-methylase UbiE
LANAEAIPAPDASFDAVTCVYMFHELPQASAMERDKEKEREREGEREK